MDVVTNLQGANVVAFGRTVAPGPEARRRAAVARLRGKLRHDDVIYAVRRAHDPQFGWIVCDLYLIGADDVDCLTSDIALALECQDPEREVGVKLRRAAGSDPLAGAISGRLSTILFGAPDVLHHRMIG
jgi:hypothetical protein